jgi:hypothetical protein
MACTILHSVHLVLFRRALFHRVAFNSYAASNSSNFLVSQHQMQCHGWESSSCDNEPDGVLTSGCILDSTMCLLGGSLLISQPVKVA